uniref:Uncharacterized protein n=1 Tax=Romanomermis culicivorax TaxID=13658 RepID=A0A915J2R4_ROMCU
MHSTLIDAVQSLIFHLTGRHCFARSYELLVEHGVFMAGFRRRTPNLRGIGFTGQAVTKGAHFIFGLSLPPTAKSVGEGDGSDGGWLTSWTVGSGCASLFGGVSPSVSDGE